MLEMPATQVLNNTRSSIKTCCRHYLAARKDKQFLFVQKVVYASKTQYKKFVGKFNERIFCIKV